MLGDQECWCSEFPLEKWPEAATFGNKGLMLTPSRSFDPSMSKLIVHPLVWYTFKILWSFYQQVDCPPSPINYSSSSIFTTSDGLFVGVHYLSTWNMLTIHNSSNIWCKSVGKISDIWWLIRFSVTLLQQISAQIQSGKTRLLNSNNQVLIEY